MESLFKVFFGSFIVATSLGICIGIDRIATAFEELNNTLVYGPVQEYNEEDSSLNPSDDAIVRDIALMQAPKELTIIIPDGSHLHLDTANDVVILAEQIERLEREIKLLNQRLDNQGKYIRELRDWRRKAVDDTPQTNEDYARMFSSVRHAHGMLQANLYTYVFNANRGRVDPPRILPRNYDFELPEQKPNPFPPPVVN